MTPFTLRNGIRSLVNAAWSLLLPAALVALGPAMLVAASYSPGHTANLPPHQPLSVIVIADRVNPHGLSAADLTEPGDLAPALNGTGSDLSLKTPVVEFNSQCVDGALAVLQSAEPPDVVVYFAHLPARGCDDTAQQSALTAALETHLQRGGGVVVFHHGGYVAEGKEAILNLFGGGYTGVEYSVEVGQDVVCLVAGHFVTANGLVYPGHVAYSNPALGIPASSYEQFINAPAERYLKFQPYVEPDEFRRYLFGSTFGPSHGVLTYELQRPGWRGRVLTYQPGEYAPRALAPEGRNFQILANAIYWSTHGPQIADPDPPDGPADGSTDDPGNGSESTDGDLNTGPSVTDADAAPKGGCSVTHGGRSLPYGWTLIATFLGWLFTRRAGR